MIHILVVDDDKNLNQTVCLRQWMGKKFPLLRRDLLDLVK